MAQALWWPTVFISALLFLLRCSAAPSQVEIEALLSLKQLNVPEGRILFNNWTVQNSMFVCTNWSGVRCNQAHTHVIELQLSDTGLQGTLPPQFGNLSWLEVLSLGNNSFQGSFPRISRWTNLEWIDLSDNDFTGLPPSLEAAQGLKLLSLRSNGFQGELPAWLWNLTKLEVLSLGNNSFQGSFPRISRWTNLEWIDLSDNDFTGLPPSLEAAQGLKLLSLRSNGFQGELPAWLWNLTELSILDLSSNKFQGIIPPQSFGLLKGFMVNTDKVIATVDPRVEIYFNIKGAFRSYKNISRSFTLFDVSDNNLGGILPSDFDSLKFLRFLNLSRNSFSDGIPHELGDLSLLEMLDVSYNQLSGSIPLSLVNLHNLASFNVSFNDLTGRIPDGGQFPTFDGSCFQDNRGLCGNVRIGIIPCVTSPTSPSPNHVIPRYRDWWLVALALGFVVGYSGVIWMVVIWDSAWTYTFLSS